MAHIIMIHQNFLIDDYATFLFKIMSWYANFKVTRILNSHVLLEKIYDLRKNCFLKQ